MRTIWKIQVDMRNQWYDWPDWVGKTYYRCNYMQDRHSYLLYPGWLIDSHTKFSQVPVSHDDFPRTLSSHSFLSWILPPPKNTKLSYLSLSHLSMIKSYHRVQHTLSTAYTWYYIQHVLHHPMIDCLPLPSQSLISWLTMRYSILYICTIAS